MTLRLVSILKHHFEITRFSIQKDAIFFKVKEIKGLRGGVRLYAAQENPKIDAGFGKKSPFWTKTNLFLYIIDTVDQFNDGELRPLSRLENTVK